LTGGTGKKIFTRSPRLHEMGHTYLLKNLRLFWTFVHKLFYNQILRLY
jgi:hypothetical protein